MLKNAPRKWLIVIVFVAVSCSVISFLVGYFLGRSIVYSPKIEERVYTDAENYKKLKQQQTQENTRPATEQQEGEIKYHTDTDALEEKSEEAANNE